MFESRRSLQDVMLLSDLQSDKASLQFDAELGEEFSRLIGEFLDITQADARKLLNEEFQRPGGFVADAWRKENPQTPDEITKFYQETNSYIYDLAADHCNLRRQPVRDAIIQRIEKRGPNQKVLLFGDGIGNDSIMIARRGHSVTYFDLCGVTSAFARFRFRKEGLDQQIAVAESESHLTAENFDVVVCVEVLEHVPDPPAVMKTIHGALKRGGIALITESFESVGDEFPSHLPQNLQYAGRTHRLMERLGFANTYYNTNPINRPIEFTKIGQDWSGKLLRLTCSMRRALESRLRFLHTS